MLLKELCSGLGTHILRGGGCLGTSGNLSAVLSREPLRLAITASSIDKGTDERRPNPGDRWGASENDTQIQQAGRRQKHCCISK